MATQKIRLVNDADTFVEDAQSGYESFGWSLYTNAIGHVQLQAVEYEELMDDDEAIVARLVSRHPGLTENEAGQIVWKARWVRTQLDTVEGLHYRAVAAYERGDVNGVLDALKEATDAELEMGWSPDTDALRSELLTQDDD